MMAGARPPPSTASRHCRHCKARPPASTSSVESEQATQEDAMTRAVGATARADASMVQERYRAAGVDTDEADAGLKKLTARIAETWPPRGGFGSVKLDIGYFANVIDVGGQG